MYKMYITQFSSIFHEHIHATKQYFFAERRCDLRLFPTVSPWTPLDLQKKIGVARKRLIKKMRVGQVLAWSCFRPFPTFSDCFRPFHFSERLIGPIPFMEGWSSANPCKPWRLSFLVPPLCAYTAPNIASWPWYPIFPKNHKIPGAREI